MLSHIPLSGALSWNTRTRMRAVGNGSFETFTVTVGSVSAVGSIPVPPLLYVPAAVGSTDTKYLFEGSTLGCEGATQPSPAQPAARTGM